VFPLDTSRGRGLKGYRKTLKRIKNAIWFKGKLTLNKGFLTFNLAFKGLIAACFSI